jgi:cell division protein FtsN
MNMLNRKNIAVAAALVVATLSFTGCKPSENNYRSAYETATKQKQAAAVDEDIDLTNVIMEDTPKRATTEVGDAYVRYDLLSVYGDAPKKLSRFNLAVAAYKMRANAESDAEQLRNAGYDAFIMQDGKNTLYVMVASCDNITEAVTFLNEYKKKNPDRPYVGLPGEAVVYIR